MYTCQLLYDGSSNSNTGTRICHDTLQSRRISSPIGRVLVSTMVGTRFSPRDCVEFYSGWQREKEHQSTPMDTQKMTLLLRVFAAISTATIKIWMWRSCYKQLLSYNNHRALQIATVHGNDACRFVPSLWWEMSAGTPLGTFVA